MYDEYGEVIMEDDGYYYGPRGPEVLPFLGWEFHTFIDNVKNVNCCLNTLCVHFIIETANLTLCDIPAL